MDLSYFEKKVTFTQKIKSLNAKGYKAAAEVYFMVCDAEKCLPPEYVDLEFNIPASAIDSETSEEKEVTGEVLENKEPEQVVGGADDVSDDYLNATKWEYFSTKNEDGSYDFHFKGTIGEGWHLYSQKQK